MQKSSRKIQDMNSKYIGNIAKAILRQMCIVIQTHQNIRRGSNILTSYLKELREVEQVIPKYKGKEITKFRVKIRKI